MGFNKQWQCKLGGGVKIALYRKKVFQIWYRPAATLSRVNEYARHALKVRVRAHAKFDLSHLTDLKTYYVKELYNTYVCNNELYNTIDH